ncbi:hypothetical protein Q3G72_024397 [Acer saccharum]|nr:hypothetical protein Q3G72_024397 [Acer saccharum]
MAEWSEIPEELLHQVAQSLDTSFDFFRFRTVCSTWRSSVEQKLHRLPGRFPILPNNEDDNHVNVNSSNACFGFHLSKRTVYLIRPPQTRNETESVATTKSWLVKVEEGAPNRKRLLNPLKRHRFEFSEVIDIEKLSILEIGHEYVLNYINCCPNALNDGNLYMEKVVLMNLGYSEGDFDAFVLLTIHVSGKLAIFKSSDKKWTILQDMPSPYDDVMLYKGNFYAVDNSGRTVLIDYSSFHVSLVANPVFGGDKKYLVECKGDLLLVDMYLSIDSGSVDSSVFDAYFMTEKTVKFEAFKLDEGSKEWVNVDNLNENLLFLGEDCCFSASIDDLHVSKGNNVLFVDSSFILSGENDEGDGDGHDHDVGVVVFDFENQCIKPVGQYPEYSKLFWPPPSWITSTMLEVQNHSEEPS